MSRQEKNGYDRYITQTSGMVAVTVKLVFLSARLVPWGINSRTGEGR